MAARILLAVALVSVLGAATWAQTPGPSPGPVADSAWRSADGAAASAAGMAAAQPGSEGPHRTIARVSSGSGTLPNQQGQVWREYDISPYTARVTTTKRPEQAIVDWILRETGYEVWHSEPLGILSATPRTLRVYHTPEMQALVAEVVDRFVASEAENQTFSLRVMTIDSPNWRVRAQSVLHAVPVQTPGRQRLDLAPRGCGGGAGRIGSGVAITANTVRRTCWSTTAKRRWFPACGRGATSVT